MNKLAGIVFLSVLVVSPFTKASDEDTCANGNLVDCLADAAGKIQKPRFSDRALKQNEVVIDDGLNKVTLINGKQFEWKGNNKKDIGVIAQEVETVFPELVTVDKKTSYKQVNYAGLVGVLIEAVKELKKENDRLKLQLGIYD
ncbi:tail fiber domain-containing protein [Zooshikella harenae]|uniref:Tail fiber domain-containing protein n=1 Tax=Zooshikella harenae TaxID=2827238 RepID=A0ABS5ZJ05_9GAMM|nr:tail fiber domain-containing protein [Zooshikella harenae]MBU2714056.1 tail fiber domain-containing protein [Zooshikella harenae]